MGSEILMAVIFWHVTSYLLVLTNVSEKTTASIFRDDTLYPNRIPIDYTSVSSSSTIQAQLFIYRILKDAVGISTKTVSNFRIGG
jgi:hypothetical protein